MSNELTDARKVQLLRGRGEWHVEAAPELDLPEIMVTDGPHGLRKVSGDGLLDQLAGVPATCYPTASALGSSWDRELAREIGVAIGGEARDIGVSVVLGPGVNIKRHPRCGRNFEYLSEDPLLAGELAAAIVQGTQSTGIGTSLKHYAVNNQESHRMVVDVVVDERTLREVYLPAFETTVTTAQPWTVMCAYNLVNGTYCAEHPWLLTTVLRDEWGFEGLVMTDWGANNDRVAGIRAGLDLEMPGSGVHDGTVLAAVEDGTLDRAHLDASAGRVVRLLEQARDGRSDAPVATPAERHALARRAAAASAVLLKNDGGLLPLDRSTRIAVVGEMAVVPRYQGGGSSRVNATHVEQALTELRELAGGRVTYAPGYDATAQPRPDLLDEAVAVAAQAEVAIVFVGLPPSWESEGFDREHLRLPEPHNDLVRAVAAVNPNTVVVLANGAPVTMPWVDAPGAILEAHLGGEAAGGAIADVLFGEAEPGGRLAETYPVRPQDLAADRWFPGTARQVEYREGVYVGYRWTETVGADTLFPFGHGLSFTTFDVGGAALSASAIDADDSTTLTVDVTNTGSRSGSHVVQVYVRAPAGRVVHRPDRELRGFEKVHLAPGETTTVHIDLGPRAFAHWDVASGSWQVEAGTYDVLVGSSAQVVHAALPIEVRSAFVPAREPEGSPYAELRPDDWDVDDAAFTAALGRPIPVNPVDRPFDRNSTVGDVGTTWFGRPLVKAIRAGAARATRGADTDGGLGVMVDRALVELPLRNAAAMSKGAVSLRNVDRFIALLNKAGRRRG